MRPCQRDLWILNEASVLSSKIEKGKWIFHTKSSHSPGVCTVTRRLHWLIEFPTLTRPFLIPSTIMNWFHSCKRLCIKKVYRVQRDWAVCRTKTSARRAKSVIWICWVTNLLPLIFPSSGIISRAVVAEHTLWRLHMTSLWLAYLRMRVVVVVCECGRVFPLTLSSCSVIMNYWMGKYFS